MQQQKTNTYRVDIFIAGERSDAVRVCREFCWDVGLCVSVMDCDFVYTGGSEKGVRVGLINYPRFPAECDVILNRALALAELLLVGLAQKACSVVADDRTIRLERTAPERT